MISIFKNWPAILFSYYNFHHDDYLILKTKNNLEIKIRQKSTDLYALFNIWLFEEYNRDEIKNSTNIIIDIGAHIGLFSLYASQIYKPQKIFAFEPVEKNFKLLSQNIKNNNLENIEIFNMAVSDSDISKKLFIHEDDSGHSIFLESTNSITVPSITLKSIFDQNKIEICDLLKLDCEGAEYEIINTIPPTYFKKIKNIILEYHMEDKQPEMLEQIKKILTSQNFEIKINPSSKGMGMLYAIQNE